MSRRNRGFSRDVNRNADELIYLKRPVSAPQDQISSSSAAVKLLLILSKVFWKIAPQLRLRFGSITGGSSARSSSGRPAASAPAGTPESGSEAGTGGV